MSTARPQERNLRTAALALLILGCVIVLRPFLTASLMALIVLHVAAALWHQFVRRDGLLRRMGFGINR